MKVHETAFITCAYRSSDVLLSGDPYAKLWDNPATKVWVDGIINEVSPAEPYLHCLRNRYFLTAMIDFFDQNPDGVLVNFGSGFSMYPFLIPKHINCMDIDQEDIISYKNLKLNEWMMKGLLPQRDLSYVMADFRDKDPIDIITKIRSWIDGRPSFFLLEGVLYFLSASVTDRLFHSIKLIQKEGDLLGCVSFLPESAQTKVQLRLNDYFDKHNFTNDTFSHQMLSTESYHNRSGYSLIDHQDYIDLSIKYTPEKVIKDKFSILNENMYLLVRNKD
ncbi:MAG: class I SAM-dependent methyltransferase [Saprospiraceae bacterium]|nr:class I SAM-dependent methyltransferase [Saprospiraceae bacterium]